MSELIAAKAKGDLLERYKKEKPPEDAEVTESEYVRELLDDGLAAREQSLYERVGLPARLGARLEDERRTGETEADVVREVLEDGVEARRADALDAIDASDELRAAVEAERQEGEDVDAAVRRLLGDAVANSRTQQLARVGSSKTVLLAAALLASSIIPLALGAYVLPAGDPLILWMIFLGAGLQLVAVLGILAATVANIALARPVVATAVGGLRDRLGA